MSNSNYDGPGCAPDSTSPLLRRFPNNNKRPNKFDPSYNQTNSNFNGVRNRLGPKCPFTSKNPSNEEGINRKRPLESAGPIATKRRWPNNAYKPYYNDPNYNQESPQNRINRIRTGKNTSYLRPQKNLGAGNFTVTTKNEILNESQESDVADITIQVVNQNAKPVEDSITRFKMVLDDKTQKAIKLIQQKRKEKQVIFPLPVTPTVTGISMHERFSML